MQISAREQLESRSGNSYKGHCKDSEQYSYHSITLKHIVMNMDNALRDITHNTVILVLSPK